MIKKLSSLNQRSFGYFSQQFQRDRVAQERISRSFRLIKKTSSRSRTIEVNGLKRRGIFQPQIMHGWTTKIVHSFIWSENGEDVACSLTIYWRDFQRERTGEEKRRSGNATGAWKLCTVEQSLSSSKIIHKSQYIQVAKEISSVLKMHKSPKKFQVHLLSSF